MGFSVAHLALLAWPVVTGVLFVNLPLRRAMIWSILAGFLLLPQNTAIDLPGVPALDRDSIPSLAVLALLLLAASERPRLIPRSRLACLLIALLLLGYVGTALTNGDRLSYGPKELPGLSLYDAASLALASVTALIPFLLARHYLARREDHELLVGAFLLAGLAYSVPALFEIRMSPQLHDWVYGFFPHDWGQQKRFGGFRAVVFLRHGIWVGFFMALVLVAAAAVWRLSEPERRPARLLAVAYLAVVVALCKVVSAWALALIALPAVMLLPPGIQVRLAGVLVAATLLYPTLRGGELFPTETIIETAKIVGPGRATSLAYRFDNEDILIEKARSRPVFGWGSWGRNRVFDPNNGASLSTTDGVWIIQFGSYGWVGFLAQFGLMALPVLLLWRRRPDEMPVATAALAVMLAINMVNLLPNSTLMPLTWLMAGALLGYAEATAPERPATGRTRRAATARAGPPRAAAAGGGRRRPRPGETRPGRAEGGRPARAPGPGRSR